MSGLSLLPNFDKALVIDFANTELSHPRLISGRTGAAFELTK